jgi:nicotinate-nucleotide adenylyltransferase
MTKSPKAARLETAFGPKATGAAAPFRIAFFGGSFDPPHLGHTGIAAAAADRFDLDEVWFEPAGVQPLKPPTALSPYADRLAMTRLACQCDPRFVAHQHDAPRTDGLPNYTVDALIQLNNTLSGNDTLFCIVGVDAFRELDRWHRPIRLLGQAQWIVAGRPGFSLTLEEMQQALPPCTISQITDRGLTAYDCVGDKFSTRVYLFDSLRLDISATQVRLALRAGAPADEWIAPPVAEYIRTHNLYR